VSSSIKVQPRDQISLRLPLPFCRKSSGAIHLILPFISSDIICEFSPGSWEKHSPMDSPKSLSLISLPSNKILAALTSPWMILFLCVYDKAFRIYLANLLTINSSNLPNSLYRDYRVPQGMYSIKIEAYSFSLSSKNP
jgi:hypothetical protein